MSKMSFTIAENGSIIIVQCRQYDKKDSAGCNDKMRAIMEILSTCI